MVFMRLAAGLVVGMTVPMMVKEDVYVVIANSFVRPHLRHHLEKEKMIKDKAVSIAMLDTYVKDVVGSFLLFFVLIGPAIYYSYL